MNLYNKISFRSKKVDFDQFRIDVQYQVATQVAQAVSPLQDEVSKLSSRTKKLEEQLKNSAAGGERSYTAYDSAVNQVAFIGWPDSADANARLNLLENYLRASFASFRPLKLFNDYKGPYSKRTLGKVAFVEFATKDEVREFLKAFNDSGSEVKVHGTKLKVAAALTKLNKSRNWALNNAHELVRAAAAEETTVEVQKKPERKVLVNENEAFVQPKDVPKGSFVGHFAHLELP